MKNEVVTIGDSLKDIFVFPAEKEMERPISEEEIRRPVHGEKFLLFEFGDKITISHIHYDIGGSACNVAVGLAKLGVKAAIISSVGADSEGEQIIERLHDKKVNTEMIHQVKGKNTSFSIVISYKGERSILVFRSFVAADFSIPEQLDTDWIYASPLGEGYKTLYSKLTSLAIEKNIKIALNPGDVQIHDGLMAFGGILRVAKVLFLNREEAAKLAGFRGVATVKDVSLSLLKTGVETVVITDGRDGAYAARGEEFIKIGAYPGNRFEVTGAGDSFASAFLSAYIRDEKLFECLKWGVTNSASVIEKTGAQDGLLSSNVIKKRINEYRWPASSMRFS